MRAAGGLRVQAGDCGGGGGGGGGGDTAAVTDLSDESIERIMKQNDAAYPHSLTGQGDLLCIRPNRSWQDVHHDGQRPAGDV